MKKKALLASAALAVLGATSVNAAVVVNTTLTGTPAAAAGTATGYEGWVISLSSSTGNITAVDLSGPEGVKGAIVQRWTDPEGEGNYVTKTPTNTAKNAAQSNNNFDSHFLPPGGDVGNMLVGSALNEDATIGAMGSTFGSFPANTGLAGVGQGTLLQGAYGIAAAVQSANLEVAYIVKNALDEVPFSIQVATAQGGTERVTGVLPAVPEPASMAVLGLGMLGLAFRRR